MSSSVRDVDSLLQRHESMRDSSVRIEEMSRELSQLREELQSLETEMQTSPDTANFVPYRPEMSPCALMARWALCMGAGSVAAGVYTVAAGTRSATAPRLPTLVGGRAPSQLRDPPLQPLAGLRQPRYK